VTRLLLDTTYLIDAERGGPTIDQTIQDEDDVAIAAITIAELMVGVLLASGDRRASRRAYVDEIMGLLPVVAYDTAIAIEHAHLLSAVREAGRPRGAHDLLIAATARATTRTVVTADAKAFCDLPGVVTLEHR
jgi:tRNA(fMet)-specific endonuclease VapC